MKVLQKQPFVVWHFAGVPHIWAQGSRCSCWQRRVVAHMWSMSSFHHRWQRRSHGRCRKNCTKLRLRMKGKPQAAQRWARLDPYDVLPHTMCMSAQLVSQREGELRLRSHSWPASATLCETTAVGCIYCDIVRHQRWAEAHLCSMRHLPTPTTPTEGGRTLPEGGQSEVW